MKRFAIAALLGLVDVTQGDWDVLTGNFIDNEDMTDVWSESTEAWGAKHRENQKKKAGGWGSHKGIKEKRNRKRNGWGSEKPNKNQEPAKPAKKKINRKRPQSRSYSICKDTDLRWSDESNSFALYQKYLSGQEVFEDPSFGATMDSIYSKQDPPRDQNDLRNYKRRYQGFWRPVKFEKGKQPSLFGNVAKFAPNGIKQGGLGDCWMLAGAAAVAENHERMNKIVHVNSRQSYNNQGIFRYYFWSYNDWMGFNIDDRLPMANKYSNSDCCKKPMMTGKSLHNAWWMPLLEKAYVKFQGNYDRVQGGSGFESLRQFTAKPVFYYRHSKLPYSADRIFNNYHKYAKENYPIVVSCCDTRGQAPDGLVGGHAYTLLDTIVLDGHKLAKLRNPWSSEGYNGPWSDSDSRWTQARLQKAGHTLGNDGKFFMPFENFINRPYFRATQVAIYKNFQKTKMYTINQTVQQLKIKVQIPSRQIVYFTIETENPRFRRNCRNKPNTSINTYFFKGTRYTRNGQLVPVGYIGNSLYHGTVGEPDRAWDAGTYTIMVADWASNKHNGQEYTLTVYQEGSGTVTLSY